MESVMGPYDGGRAGETGKDDFKRLLYAVFAAALVHAVIIAIPFMNGAMKELSGGRMVVDLETSDIRIGSPEARPSKTVETVPSAPKTAGVESGSDFVIPTPKRSSSEPAALPAPGFREEGGRTGASPRSAFAAPPGPNPEFPLDSGASASASPQTQGPPQAGGKGVQVAGESRPSKGSLDLKSLDKALAGAQGGRGTGEREASRGGGSTDAGGSDIRWERPEAGKNRRLLVSREPVIPDWVREQGLTLTVTVSFLLSPQGVVSSTSLEKSCGYGDVDAAVLEAVRFWRFSADPGSAPIRGLVPYKIRAR